MKRFVLVLVIFFSFPVFSDETTVTSRFLFGDDPRSGLIHTLCIEGYKFTLFWNHRTVTTSAGYAGESQVASMVQIINDEGNGIKCSEE